MDLSTRARLDLMLLMLKLIIQQGRLKPLYTRKSKANGSCHSLDIEVERTGRAAPDQGVVGPKPQLLFKALVFQNHKDS